VGGVPPSFDDWRFTPGGLRQSAQHGECGSSGWSGSDRRCGAEPVGRGVAAMVALIVCGGGGVEQLGHLFGWVGPSERFPGAAVERVADPVQLGLVVQGEVGAFG
jgi:hypothetical protein